MLLSRFFSYFLYFCKFNIKNVKFLSFYYISFPFLLSFFVFEHCTLNTLILFAQHSDAINEEATFARHWLF